MRNNKLNYGIRAVLVVLLFTLSTGNAWGSYNTALRTMVDATDTGKGLVYANTSNTASVTDNSYSNAVKSGNVKGSNGKNQNLYGWAKPARGYVFSKWVSYDYDNDANSSSEEGCTPQANTGTADLILVRSWGGNAGNDVCGTAKASWNSAPSFTVVYKQPVGGNYTVQYSYLTVNSSNAFVTTKEPTSPVTLTPTSGDWTPTGWEASQNGYSYAADVVTLTSSAANFEAWYENGVQKSTGSGATHSYTYPITQNANVTAIFKNAVVATPEEVSVSTNSKTVAKAASVVFDVETTGTWTADASGFTVTFQSKDGPGDFAITSKSFSAGKLTVNFTYTANDWVGTSIEMVVTPAYGTGATATIKGVAEEVIDYQARVLVGGVSQRTGNLADMLTYANTLDDTPTLQLMQNVTATATLQFKKSMIFDLNNKKLSATAVDKLILVKGNSASDKVTLTITDNSYTAAGEMGLTRSAAATSVGAEIADENKLTLQKGILTVANNTAAAQGVHISGNGTLLMQGGKVEATAKSDARGIYAENGFATIMSGSIDATAGTKAYALYTAATSNISSGVSLGATTTTGAEATAIYVNGGKTVLDNVTLTTDAKTTNAYGAYVKAGALSVNGGSITATAASSDVFGINILSGASATVQQQAVIVAESTGSKNVFGIQNAGTLQLTNSTITSTAATNYAYAVQTKSGAVSTTIEDGTYVAVSATGETYGLHHQSGTLNANGVTFTASAAGNNVYGSYLSESATLVNTTIKGETTGSAQYAYGVMANTEGKNISLTGCDIEAKSANAYAYAIRNNANMTATGCTLLAKTSIGAYAYGVYAEKGANTLTNTNATVEAYTTGAYGVNYLAGTLTVNEGTYNVEARQASASALADSEVYGVKVADGKTANLSNATVTVRGSSSSWSRNAYGVYTGTGTINSTTCTYTVSASQKAYGVYGAASSTLTLQDNIISATTTSSVTAYGIYSNSMFSIKGDKVTSDAQSYDSYPLYFAASAVGTVQSGWFKALGTPGNNTQIVAPINTASNNANVKVQGGFFNDMVQLRFYVPSGYDIYGVDPDAAEHAAGYYYTVNDHVPYENVCYITEVSRGFPTLEDAFDYARNHAGTNYNILMIQPYTLPAGNYSLPSNATLVVPYKASQTKAIGATPQRRPRDMEQIAENRLLTIASGANVDVAGKIEVSAEQYVFNVGGIGYVQGPYGRIHMEEGSTITLNSGAAIYAWGYITGQGEIRVKNGAKVHEQFNIQDMKGTKDLSDNWLDNDQNTFPVNQYYIQNVEAPTKYYYGSQLLGYTGFTTSSASTSVNTANGIKLVGTSDNFFNVDSDDESSWVRKRYDPATDRTIWETNSSASLGSMNINISGYGMNTKDYILPITNNMTIHILSGKFKVTQSTVFLPGATLEIDKTATLLINAKDTKSQAMGLYLYDQAQWTTNATLPVYSPSWVNGVCPRAKEYSKMKDAAIYVKGKIEVDGAIYTTAGGAAIYSDPENAGTIVFNAAAGGDKTIYKTYATNTAVTTTSAQLRNGGVSGSTFTATKSVAAAGDTYAYMDLDKNGNYEWTNLATVDECVVKDKSTNVYYAKPKDYVAITSATEDGDHLFHSVTGNRLFIQQTMEAGCQWWEVTRVGETSVYRCATNDTYYEYKNGEWQEKVVHVTFYFTDPKDDAANKKKVLEVNYGAKPDASIVSNPSKAADAAATYQFYGWKSSDTETEYAYTAELENAFEDMYYLPVFTSITKKYTITFKKAKNNTDVQVECFYGQSPEYAASWVSSAQYDYEFTGWKAADGTVYPRGTELPSVEGATYYTAQWINHLRSYDITWMNGETELEVDQNQSYGTVTVYNGATPTKAADDDYAYEFSGWHNSLTNAPKANNETVTGAITYTAQYNTTPRYAVTFANYDGSQLARTVYTQGETPAYDGTPARKRDADGYFRFIGWKNSNGTAYAPNATLPAVTKKETYTAQYDYVTDLFIITLNNVDGAGATWSGKFGVGSIPFYNPNDDDVPVTPTKAGNAQYSYVFSSWSPAMIPVDGEATYTAVFSKVENKHSVSIKAGAKGAVSPASVSGIGCETASADITATPDAGYAFNGWTLPDGVTAADGYTVASNPIRIHAIAADKTITANFVARNDINYTVKHWQQNIADDNYTEVTTDQETKQGTTATTTAATVKSYTGFTAQPFSQKTISGEGTTVVNIYYNRKTYLIKWDVKLNGEQEAYKEETLRYGAMPSYGADPTKEQSESQVFSFSGWKPILYAVDKDQTYNGSFNVSPRQYTITFVNDDGTELWHSDFDYGSTPSYRGSTPLSDTFAGWSPEITTVAGEATYTATYLIANIEVKENQSKDVTVSASTNVTTVHVRGTLDVQNGVTLNTGDLILEGSANNNWEMSSGEIIGEGTVSATNAYYDMSPASGYQERIWYAVAVPWKVSVPKNAVGDVYDADGHQLRLNLDFDLLYYNGESRATGGTNNWNSVAKDAEDKWVMKPGIAYMIYLARPTSKLRFKKSSGDLLTTRVSVKPYEETTNNNGKDANWNGIANPALYHAYLNAGTGDGNWGQIFVPGNAQRDGGSYTAIHMDENALVVGQPIFVQAQAEKSIVAHTLNENYESHAPRRAQAEVDDQNVCYTVEISSNGKFGDRIFVATNDDKEDVYTIGQDVSKLGVSATRPQMWVSRYDSKLCVNTIALSAKKATYPLGISVPADGDYEIAVVSSIQDNQELYVTLNGRAIWNMAYGPYYVTLNKGTHTQYGLKLVQKAPTITTGVDNAEGINDANGVRKVLIDDQIYIIREGVVYTINGQQVK